MLLTVCSLAGCSKFLETKPKGTLTESDLNSSDAIEGLLTAAYAAIGNDDREDPITSMWAYGSVHSDDAYKGGGAVNNRTEYDALEQYYTIEAAQIPNDAGFPATWTNLYRAISRVNFALKKLNTVSEADFPQKKVRQGEAHFLRGHLNFLLKILFKYFPYIDETASDEEILKISNRKYTNDELWDKVAEALPPSARARRSISPIPPCSTATTTASPISSNSSTAPTPPISTRSATRTATACETSPNISPAPTRAIPPAS